MYKLVQPPWKTVGRVPKKLKVQVLYGPAIPLLGIYPKNYMNSNKRYRLVWELRMREKGKSFLVLFFI